jgi:hypothetical protein
VEFGALPGGKIGVIAHQEGSPPLKLIIDGVVGDQILARRMAEDTRERLIQQQLQGPALKLKIAEKEVLIKDDEKLLMLSSRPIDMPNVAPPREPLNP